MTATQCKALMRSLDPERGDFILARLTHANIFTIRNFLENGRKPPIDILERLDYLRTLINYLQGSYNQQGILHWLKRDRKELSGRSPNYIFRSDWKPEDRDSQKILELAKSLTGSDSAA